MSKIDEENAKDIRDPMDILITLGSVTPKIKLTDTITAGSGYYTDTNLDEMIDTDAVQMISLYDLSGEGFRVGEPHSFYTASHKGSDDGKYGIRTAEGGSLSLTVSASSEFASVTVHVTAGSGTITSGGKSYKAADKTIIPVNAKNTVLTFQADTGTRLEISSILPGTQLIITPENLISCTVTLRSDLSIVNSSWQVSEIEVSAYYPEDISEAIANMSDDEIITYQAGYEGDLSEIRRFYLSEPAQMSGHVITIKGEDSSAKLEDKTYPAFVAANSAGSGKREIYARLEKFVKDSGISLVHKENSPAKSTENKKRYIAYESQTARDAVQDIMTLGHSGDFYPVFIDAGVPTLRWSKPAVKWTIKEDDIGDETRTVDRNIAKITIDGDIKLNTVLTRDARKTVEKDKKTTKGERYKATPEGGYWSGWSVTNATDIIGDATGVLWEATKTSKKYQKYRIETYKSGKNKGKKHKVKAGTGYKPLTTVTAVRYKVIGGVKSIVDKNHRPGATETVTPKINGKIYQGSSVIFPLWSKLFDRDNRTISFKCKGDPRMQPRDVLRIVWEDGTYQDVTISEISISHENGGTTSTISARYGVI